MILGERERLSLTLRNKGGGGKAFPYEELAKGREVVKNEQNAITQFVNGPYVAIAFMKICH